jgi:hypothetical protein
MCVSDLKNMVLSLIPQEWVEPEQQGQRRTKHYFAKQYFKALGNLLAGLLWSKEPLRLVQWLLHEAKFKQHILRLANGLLEDNPDCRLHFCELMLNCRI